MQSVRSASALLITLALTTAAHAAGVTFNWVTVGDPGNAADPLNSGSVPGIGSVADTYRISAYEVTNEQYKDFLNAVAASDPNGLYSTSMDSDDRGGITRSGSDGSYTYSTKTNMGDKPVNYVSWLDSARFINWLENGQGSGDTENGVYDMSLSATSIIRQAGATYFIPTENEWYKAAYYDPTPGAGGGDNYWLYPTQSDSAPTEATATVTGDIGNPGTNVVNHHSGADWNSQNGNVTTVGSAGSSSDSFYGTFDQGGNLWEWNETPRFTGSSRGQRGGAWNVIEDGLRSSYRGVGDSATEFPTVGFRVAAAVAVPLPSAVWAGMSLLGVVAAYRRYRTVHQNNNRWAGSAIGNGSNTSWPVANDNTFFE